MDGKAIGKTCRNANGNINVKAGEYELACRHFLMHVDGIGSATAMKMVDRYGCARRIWELQEKDIVLDRTLNGRQKSSFLEVRKCWDMGREWKKLKDKGIRVVGFDDPAYPGRLREIPDKPFLLYYRGRLPEEAKPSVAIIGARMCSGYGRAAAWEFAAGLAGRGIQVVSGMADGIDGIAQRSALEHGGMSYGVLGCGVDVCYPLSNRPLYQELLAHGGILSEFLPGTKPEAGHFPMRNRIISGLADLILVIEAKERSGTGITVNMALEQGREVYAVPGRITDELSRGCHRMIREGAGMATDIGEVAEAAKLAWERNCCLNWGKQRRPAYAAAADEATDDTVKENAVRSGGQQKKEAAKRKEAGREEQERKRPEGKDKMEIAFREKDGQRRNVPSADMEGRVMELLGGGGMDADEILSALLSQQKGRDGGIDISVVQRTLSALVLAGNAVCRGGIYEISGHPTGR